MSEATIYSDSFLAMESHCDVVLPNVLEDIAKQIFARVKTEVESLENQLNRFYTDSPIAELCQAKANEWTSVSDEIWDVLTICYDLYQMSNGAFDVTIGALVELWETEEKPTEAEIAKAKQKCGFDKVELDFEKQKVRLLQDGIIFDFDGIQKGLALDRLKPILEELSIKDAIVSFGEDAVLALGSHPNGGDWPIGIRNQLNPMQFVHVFPACNQTIISVGAMEKEGMQDEITKTYTICPETGNAVSSKNTISVKSNSGVVGAFLAICYLVLPENDRGILSDNFKGIEIFEATYLDDDIKTSISILNENE